jgi:hypothetical protein
MPLKGSAYENNSWVSIKCDNNAIFNLLKYAMNTEGLQHKWSFISRFALRSTKCSPASTQYCTVDDIIGDYEQVRRFYEQDPRTGDGGNVAFALECRCLKFYPHRLLACFVWLWQLSSNYFPKQR